MPNATRRIASTIHHAAGSATIRTEFGTRYRVQHENGRVIRFWCMRGQCLTGKFLSEHCKLHSELVAEFASDFTA